MKKTQLDTSRLDALEKIIDAGQKAFMEVALAIMEIRDAKLYRRDYKTFAAYCEGRWNWSRQRGMQLIAAAEVVKSLPREMTTIVVNEAQARALADVPEAERESVLRSASDDVLTAASIADAAEAWTPGLAEQAMIDRIGKLWVSLSEVEGTPESSMVKSANKVREIGLHVAGLAGLTVNAKKIAGLKKQLPAKLDLAKCRLCVKVSKALKEKVRMAEEAMPTAELVMRIRGVAEAPRHRETQHARELAPATAIFAALNNAQLKVDKEFRNDQEWCEADDASVKSQLERHLDWVKGLLAKWE